MGFPLAGDCGNQGLIVLLYEFMSQQSKDLTDAQWMILDPLIPEPRGAKMGEAAPGKVGALF
jgi:hypothetical protein